MTRSQAAGTDGARSRRRTVAFSLYLRCADFPKIVKRTLRIWRFAWSKSLATLGKEHSKKFSEHITNLQAASGGRRVNGRHCVPSAEDLVVGIDGRAREVPSAADHPSRFGGHPSGQESPSSRRSVRFARTNRSEYSASYTMYNSTAPSS